MSYGDSPLSYGDSPLGGFAREVGWHAGGDDAIWAGSVGELR